jgi:hypothetical protein
MTEEDVLSFRNIGFDARRNGDTIANSDLNETPHCGERINTMQRIRCKGTQGFAEDFEVLWPTRVRIGRIAENPNVFLSRGMSRLDT